VMVSMRLAWSVARVSQRSVYGWDESTLVKSPAFLMCFVS
jgi:hypothetical protein